MRTKALLLTAALGLASVATSMAQVYSVNVVGYINTTMLPGYNLVANQLMASPNNGVNAVIPTAPEEAQLLKYSGGTYTTDIYLGGAWVDATLGTPSTTTIIPGEGFFFFNNTAAPVTTTFVGEVRTGVGLTVVNVAGFNLMSSIVPQDISLTVANGFPAIEEAQFLTYDAAAQAYKTPLIQLGGDWVDSVLGTPADARLLVGQGAFYFNPQLPGNNVVWTRTFTPNN